MIKLASEPLVRRPGPPPEPLGRVGAEPLEPIVLNNDNRAAQHRRTTFLDSLVCRPTEMIIFCSPFLLSVCSHTWPQQQGPATRAVWRLLFAVWWCTNERKTRTINRWLGKTTRRLAACRSKNVHANIILSAGRLASGYPGARGRNKTLGPDTLRAAQCCCATQPVYLLTCRPLPLDSKIIVSRSFSCFLLAPAPHPTPTNCNELKLTRRLVMSHLSAVLPR